MSISKEYIDDINFFKKRILRLVGISEKDVYECKIEQICENNKATKFEKVDNKNYKFMFPTVSFNIEFKREIEILKDDISLINSILKEYETINWKKIYKGSNVYKGSLNDYIIQRGLCNWISQGNFKYVNGIEKIINVLEDWSLKTYEGHYVCFGFLLTKPSDTCSQDINSKCDDFLNFIADDYGALISEGISSMIELDYFGNFIKYHSLTDEKTSKVVYAGKKLPLRFKETIMHYVNKEKVGLFLLNNGDIILAKNMQIKYVKRNNRWLNFSFYGFQNALYGCSIKKKALVSAIYETMLDISFAHTGGIIAIVNKKDDKWIKDKDNLISNFDFIFTDDDIVLENIDNNFEKYKENEGNKKRKLKKRFIKQLVLNGKNLCSLSYNSIDRTLRKELSGLDGACIIDNHGDILSFGAIIQNDKGSFEGGRGAAAKKLSKYGGCAIKISTDGYIELYSDGNIVYQIK